jgi:hypothetical protein
MTNVELLAGAPATSGDYERFVDVNGGIEKTAPATPGP